MNIRTPPTTPHDRELASLRAEIAGVRKDLGEIAESQGRILAECVAVRRVVENYADDMADFNERQNRHGDKIRELRKEVLGLVDEADTGVHHIPAPPTERPSMWWKKPTLATALRIAAAFAIASASACVTYATTHVHLEVKP